MVVLVVMPVAEQRGGAEVSLQHLVQCSSPGQVDWVVVFLENGPMVEAFRGLGLKVHVVEAGRMRQAYRTATTVARISRLARRERAGMILGWMTKGHLYGASAAFLTSLPAVCYQHGVPDRRDGLGRLAVALPTCGIITVSQMCANSQERLRPARRQVVVYPGAELDRFDPDRLPSQAEMRARLHLPQEVPLIGMVARLQRWKGVHVLIDAMALLRQHQSEAHCVVVGGVHELEPDYPAQLEHQIACLGLGPHVTFAGLQHNVPDWMHAMDVFVHASDREPFGIVVIEAMSLGKPVVAGSEGGPGEIVTHGIDGQLVAYGDATGLATALRRYIDDPGFAVRIGAAARQRASDFAAAKYADNVLAALRTLSE